MESKVKIVALTILKFVTDLDTKADLLEAAKGKIVTNFTLGFAKPTTKTMSALTRNVKQGDNSDFRISRMRPFSEISLLQMF